MVGLPDLLIPVDGLYIPALEDKFRWRRRLRLNWTMGSNVSKSTRHIKVVPLAETYPDLKKRKPKTPSLSEVSINAVFFK